jgi:hypothetical protein
MDVLERELAAMLRRIEKALKPVMASRDLIALRQMLEDAELDGFDGERYRSVPGRL